MKENTMFLVIVSWPIGRLWHPKTDYIRELKEFSADSFSKRKLNIVFTAGLLLCRVHNVYTNYVHVHV